MRPLLLAAAIAALAVPAFAQTASQREERGALRVENVPVTPADVSERLRQYVNTRSAGFADWLPDGGVLIYTRFGDTVQLHRVDQPIGARTQLTFLYAAVRRNGGEAWLMIAMNEGHGFSRRENQEAQREAETLFFRRVLGLDQ